MDQTTTGQAATGRAAAVQVAAAREGEWQTLRGVRLAALADSPSMFGSTTAREEAFEEERWRSWARSGRVFLATVDGHGVGISAGFLDEDRTDVVSMWVDPRWRGGPVASRLLLAVVTWATQTGAPELGLTVMAENHRAAAFYARHGFIRVTPGAGTRPSGVDPARNIHRMVLPLGG